MNVTDIKVSVIMPIYNAYDYLRPAIDSVLDQTLKEIELICVDDGSTDSSFDLIKEYQKKDERIRIVTETNAGPALARNNGIKRARGEYIAFLDADDFFEPTLLEKLYALATEKDLDIALCEYDIFNSRRATFEAAPPVEHGEIYKDGEVTSKRLCPDKIFLSTNGAAWNKLFRRSFVIEKQLVFLNDAKVYEDVYFTVSALSLAERVAKVSEVLVHHRIYTDQSRSKMFRKHYAQVLNVFVALKEFLRHNGMYYPLSTSFLNLTAGRCYRIYNILGFEAKETFWDMLHNGMVHELGWNDREAEDFEEQDVCEFVASIVLYTHKQYKKRLAKGRRFTFDKLKIMFESGKMKKSFRSFFKRKNKAEK